MTVQKTITIDNMPPITIEIDGFGDNKSVMERTIKAFQNLNDQQKAILMRDNAGGAGFYSAEEGTPAARLLNDAIGLDGHGNTSIDITWDSKATDYPIADYNTHLADIQEDIYPTSQYDSETLTRVFNGDHKKHLPIVYTRDDFLNACSNGVIPEYNPQAFVYESGQKPNHKWVIGYPTEDYSQYRLATFSHLIEVINHTIEKLEKENKLGFKPQLKPKNELTAINGHQKDCKRMRDGTLNHINDLFRQNNNLIEAIQKAKSMLGDSYAANTIEQLEKHNTNLYSIRDQVESAYESHVTNPE